MGYAPILSRSVGLWVRIHAPPSCQTPLPAAGRLGGSCRVNLSRSDRAPRSWNIVGRSSFPQKACRLSFTPAFRLDCGTEVRKATDRDARNVNLCKWLLTDGSVNCSRNPTDVTGGHLDGRSLLQEIEGDKQSQPATTTQNGSLASFERPSNDFRAVTCLESLFRCDLRT